MYTVNYLISEVNYARLAYIGTRLTACDYFLFFNGDAACMPRLQRAGPGRVETQQLTVLWGIGRVNKPINPTHFLTLLKLQTLQSPNPTNREFFLYIFYKLVIYVICNSKIILNKYTNLI